LAYL